MEFGYRAGEDRDGAAPIGYFANQALRAGISLGGANPLPPPSILRREALMEELRREQMREELLAREIANQRRMEEEIRRELELERRAAMRRLEEERFLQMEMEARVGGFGEIMRPRFMPPRYPGIREDERPPSVYRDIEVDEGSASRYKERDASFKKTAFHERAAGVKKVPVRPFMRPEFSGGKNNFLSNKEPDNKLSGYKRKAPQYKDKEPDNKLSGYKRKAPQYKEWRCSLCDVIATCEKNLNVHLQGKKHQAKQEELAAVRGKSASSEDPKAGPVLPPAGKPVKKNDDRGERPPNYKGPVRKSSGKVWCNLCKVKCNSPAMLEGHLKGKKHAMAQLEKGTEGTVGHASGVENGEEEPASVV